MGFNFFILQSNTEFVMETNEIPSTEEDGVMEGSDMELVPETGHGGPMVVGKVLIIKEEVMDMTLYIQGADGPPEVKAELKEASEEEAVKQIKNKKLYNLLMKKKERKESYRKALSDWANGKFVSVR